MNRQQEAAPDKQERKSEQRREKSWYGDIMGGYLRRGDFLEGLGL